MKFEDLNKDDLDFIESRIKLKGLKSNLHIPILPYLINYINYLK